MYFQDAGEAMPLLSAIFTVWTPASVTSRASSTCQSNVDRRPGRFHRKFIAPDVPMNPNDSAKPG
jgi:hypothetical protein